MKKKTSSYILRLLILNSILLASTGAWAQARKASPKTPAPQQQEQKEYVPLYQGLSVGVEIAGLASHLLGSDILSSEIAVQANLKNRYMPVVEVGFGKADALNEGNDLHYKTSAPYFRVGMDYNVFHKKTHLPGYLYAGLRFGMTSFSYDVDGPDMTDPNYGGEISYPYSYTGLKSKACWMEAVVGLKVKIYRNFCMGWSLRYKKRIKADNHENSVPWYIPGFGKNAGSSFNLMYNLIYNLPF